MILLSIANVAATTGGILFMCLVAVSPSLYIIFKKDAPQDTIGENVGNHI